MSTKNWKIDPMHSEIQFKVKHMMISNVTGSFAEFDSTITQVAEDFDGAKIHFQANINSIDTGNEQRDGHLKAGDFFDAAQFPTLTFDSTSVQRKTDDKFTVMGNLTIKGTTHPITLDADFNGIHKDMYGNTKAGFDLAGKINRKDYGLTWNAVTETGGVMLSEDIKLVASVQFAEVVAA